MINLGRRENRWARTRPIINAYSEPPKPDNILGMDNRRRAHARAMILFRSLTLRVVAYQTRTENWMLSTARPVRWYASRSELALAFLKSR